MRAMRLVDIRSTEPERGLVAVLVEDGGPAVLAVPVTARQGLALQGCQVGRAPSWAGVVEDLVHTLGGRLIRLELDADADARIIARLVLDAADGGEPVTVPCGAGDGMVLGCTQSVPLLASAEALRLRAWDFTDPTPEAHRSLDCDTRDECD